MNYLEKICKLGWIYQGYKHNQRFKDDERFVEKCRQDPRFNYIFKYYFI